MLKKFISLLMAASLVSACVPAALAVNETKREHEETMLPAADASRQFKNNAETTAYDGNSETLWVRKNGSEIGIAYLSFDLEKAQYAVTSDSLNKVIFSYTVAAKYTSAATQLIQGRYTDIYFDIDESDYTLAQETEYLKTLHSQLCTDTSTDRFHMATRPAIKWQRQGNQLSKGATYDIDLTDLVKNTLAAGKSKFTIIIHGNVSSGQDSGQVMIASKENADETKRPKLTITTTESVPVMKNISGRIDGDVRVEGNTADTTIYGADEEIPTKDTMRGALFKFDVADMMAYKDYIKSVPITFWAKESLESDVMIYVFENSDLTWDEATFTRQTLLGDAAYNRGNLASIAGFAQNEIATVTLNGKDYTQYTVDVKSYVQKLLNQGKTSFSLIFYGASNQNQITIASKENSDTSKCPSIRAEIGVSKYLDPDWSIYPTTTGAEIPRPDIAPGFDLNVFYKEVGEADYTGMESFTEADLQNGRFLITGLDTDKKYEFLIVPSYDETTYTIFQPKTISTAADTSFAISVEKSVDADQAAAKFKWTRGNSAPSQAMLLFAAYDTDGKLTDVALESLSDLAVGEDQKNLSVTVSESTARIEAYAWQDNMQPFQLETIEE